MDFEAYLTREYQSACEELQREQRDAAIVRRAKDKTLEAEQVVDWMRHYNVLQGVSAGGRTRMARAFIRFATSQRPSKLTSATTMREAFTTLEGKLSAAHAQGKRQLSACSKLLWVLYPNDVAMYDRFAYSAMVTLEGLHPALLKRERMPARPDGADDADELTDHYVAFWGHVRTLRTYHAKTMKKLYGKATVKYRYRIRILDKLLWKLGKPGETLVR